MVQMVLAHEYPRFVETVNQLEIFLQSKDKCSEKEMTALTFFQNAQRVILEKLQSSSSGAEYANWCDYSPEAGQLVNQARRHSTPISWHLQRDAFECLTQECFKQLVFLVSSRCIQLYIDA